MYTTPPNVSSVHIGIDPGMNGGIAIIQDNSVVIDLLPMPETEHDIWKIFLDIKNIQCSVYAVIESVHAMPRQGVSSSFKFGKGYGFLRGCLVASRTMFQETTPQRWQKALGVVPCGKTETKAQFKTRLLQKTQNLFPEVPLWKTPRSKGVQLSVCDALLIAEYSRRQS
jgi:hypothetical protein